MGYRHLIISLVLLVLSAGAAVWLLLSGLYWGAGGAVLCVLFLVYRVISIYTGNLQYPAQQGQGFCLGAAQYARCQRGFPYGCGESVQDRYPRCTAGRGGAVQQQGGEGHAGDAGDQACLGRGQGAARTVPASEGRGGRRCAGDTRRLGAAGVQCSDRVPHGDGRSDTRADICLRGENRRCSRGPLAGESIPCWA